MTDYESIRKKLLSQRHRCNEIIAQNAPGVYALFLTDRTALPSLALDSDVLYIGMTESSLSVRNHFDHQHSGFSSPRRTLGALLKRELCLQAVPRASGESPTNTTNFRFKEQGEQRLIEWMKRNLAYGLFRVEENDVRKIECRLIKELKPPLNLTEWSNPQASRLRVLRRLCRNEALSATRGI